MVEQDAALVASIKTLTLGVGHTVRADGLQAVWNKGRTSWDTKGFEAQIDKIADPELQSTLLGLKKEGNPSVSIRVAKAQTEIGDLF